MNGSCRTASAVLNVHREGPLLAATLRSILHARERACRAGFRIEILAVADRPDEATLGVLQRCGADIDRVMTVQYGDLGAARQAGIDAAREDWVFLHDGDDLFSSNWYLQFFRQHRAGRIDAGSVYHTQIFARFGDLYDLRELIASDDPRFDPGFLTTEWYFSNKSVAHKSVYERFPLPRNDVRTGFGNEDWTWSCDTIHHGIRHDILPETVCFYRVKPAGKSLGLMPGMIHGPSPLFAPRHVAERMRNRAGSAQRLRSHSTLSGRPADHRLNDRPVPDWFAKEVSRQGEFESLITEFHRRHAAMGRLPAPNLHYNVSSALEYVMEGLDHRPKIFIFVSTQTLCAADAIAETFVEAASSYQSARYQPVLVLEEDEAVFSGPRLRAAYGAKLISVRELREQYQLGEWYFSRFLMRPLIQFPGSFVIDLGSSAFAEMFAQFHRTVLASCAKLRLVFLERHFDPLSPAFANIMRNAAAWRAVRNRPVPICMFRELRSLFPAGSNWQHLTLGAANRRAIDDLTRRRLSSQDPPALLDLSRILSTPARSRRPRGFWRRSSPSREFLQPADVVHVPIDGSSGALIRTSGSWVSPGWMPAALAVLRQRPEIAAVGTPVTLELEANGRYRCRWHDFSAPLTSLSAFYENFARGGAIPLVLLTREPVILPPDIAPAELAHRLYGMARDNGWAMDAVPDAVAVGLDSTLHPDLVIRASGRRRAA